MSAASPERRSLPNRILRQGMRLFYYLLYQPLAWTYDGVAALVSAGLWQDWVLSVLPQLAGSGRTLELGHGPGHLQIALGRRGLPVTGLDRSAQMGRQARRRLRAAGQPAQLVRGVAQALPFGCETFAQVISTFPTDYFLQPETQAEVWRVLAPGGRWVVLPVAWVTGGALRQRFSAFLFRVTGESPPYEDEAWIDEYAQVFRRAGFLAQARRVSLPSSEVLVIVAQRPERELNREGARDAKEAKV